MPTSRRLSSKALPPRRARSSAGNTSRSAIENGGAWASPRVRRQRRVTARIRATTSLTPNGLMMKSSAAQLQAQHAIDLLGLGADEDDRHVRVAGADLAADVVAARPRHHDVQQDEVGRLGLEARQRLAPVVGGDGVVALVRQDRGQPVADVAIVLGDAAPSCDRLRPQRELETGAGQAPAALGANQAQVAAVQAREIARDAEADAGAGHALVRGRRPGGRTARRSARGRRRGCRGRCRATDRGHAAARTRSRSPPARRARTSRRCPAGCPGSEPSASASTRTRAGRAGLEADRHAARLEAGRELRDHVRAPRRRRRPAPAAPPAAPSPARENVRMLLIRRASRWLSATTIPSRCAPSRSSAGTCSSSSSAYMRMLVSGVFSSCETWLTKLTRCAGQPQLARALAVQPHARRPPSRRPAPQPRGDADRGPAARRQPAPGAPAASRRGAPQRQRRHGLRRGAGGTSPTGRPARPADRSRRDPFVAGRARRGRRRQPRHQRRQHRGDGTQTATRPPSGGCARTAGPGRRARPPAASRGARCARLLVAAPGGTAAPWSHNAGVASTKRRSSSLAGRRLAESAGAPQRPAATAARRRGWLQRYARSASASRSALGVGQQIALELGYGHRRRSTATSSSPLQHGPDLRSPRASSLRAAHTPSTASPTSGAGNQENQQQAKAEAQRRLLPSQAVEQAVRDVLFV